VTALDLLESSYVHVHVPQEENRSGASIFIEDVRESLGAGAPDILHDETHGGLLSGALGVDGANRDFRPILQREVKPEAAGAACLAEMGAEVDRALREAVGDEEADTAAGGRATVGTATRAAVVPIPRDPQQVVVGHVPRLLKGHDIR
jgi:hypothetical protein